MKKAIIKENTFQFITTGSPNVVDKQIVMEHTDTLIDKEVVCLSDLGDEFNYNQGLGAITYSPPTLPFRCEQSVGVDNGIISFIYLNFSGLYNQGIYDFDVKIKGTSDDYQIDYLFTLWVRIFWDTKKVADIQPPDNMYGIDLYIAGNTNKTNIIDQNGFSISSSKIRDLAVWAEPSGGLWEARNTEYNTADWYYLINH